MWATERIILTLVTIRYVIPVTSTELTSYKVTTEHDVVLTSQEAVTSMTSASTSVAAQKQVFPKPSKFSPSETQMILKLHNILRRRERASNMNYLAWNQYLAEMAFEWSTQCYFEHGQPTRDHLTLPYIHLGQIMTATTREVSPLVLIEKWHSGRHSFDHEMDTCTDSAHCAKYLQLIWAETKEVGCAFSFCPKIRQTNITNAHFMVCNYGPPGRLRDSAPFRKGPACSQCESGRGWCKEELCVDSCQLFSSGCYCEARCRNCGSIDMKRCSCKCSRGWYGADCTEECVERSPHCNSTPGWPSSWCYLNYVWEKCPLMCGRCQEADPLQVVSCALKDPKPEGMEARPSTSCGAVLKICSLVFLLLILVIKTS